jgi:hypothetical protein
MDRRIFGLVLAAFSVAATAAHADAQLGNDLKATIALQGLPCDQIVSSKRNADSDYVAVCKDGHRYHVYVSPEGRVIVQSL